jgi:predicted DNA-binding protein YlxM (UPF0122 family)
MKVNYFGYSITKIEDNSHYLMDLSEFLEAYSDYSNVSFKNKFLKNDENLYLLKIKRNFYLFIITRSKEIIKKIKSDPHGNISANEIYNLLKNGENIGFASYVYINKYYFAFASKMLSPKLNVFNEFINDIFNALNINKYSFSCTPFLKESTRAEALSMPFIGKSSIKINKDNSFYQSFLSLVGSDISDFDDISSFEVIIKPKRRANIKKPIEKFLSKIPDEGLEELIIKAKDESLSNIQDLYIMSKSSVYDMIDKGDEISILSSIEAKVKSNRTLRERVNDHESNEAFTKTSIQDIDHYFAVNNWPSNGDDI